MTARETPFSLVFATVARERFPAVAEAMNAAQVSLADRDAFVLLEAVGRVLKDLLPEDAPPEALDAQLALLHHAYRHWAAGAWVYQVAPDALAAATRGGPLSSSVPADACYLQLPEQRLWAALAPGAPPEPLDGFYVARGAEPAEISVVAVFGMRRGRPGISVVTVEGRADALEPAVDEVEVPAQREDGTPAFAPTLPGADRAGLYSIASPGELLLLASRLVALLPRETGTEERKTTHERFVPVAVNG
jgi:hypothetical protein